MQYREDGRQFCACEDDGDFRYCNECLSKPCRWFAGWRPTECPACGHAQARHCGAEDCPLPGGPWSEERE